MHSLHDKIAGISWWKVLLTVTVMSTDWSGLRRVVSYHV